jgi:ATP-dependent exoDNAse (exonuclease V) beta subunit
LPRSFPDLDPSEDAKLMYVALTRAEDYLSITYSEQSSFIERIKRSGKVTAF